MKRAIGSASSRLPGMQKKRQRSSKPSGRALELGDDLRQPGERQVVRERALGALDREAQHLAPQRGEDHRDGLRRRRLELEAGRGALAGKGRLEEVEGLGDLRQGLANGIPFQPSTMRSDEAPMPSTKRPRLVSDSAAACWARSAGPRVKTPTTPVPSRSLSLHRAAATRGVKPSGPFVSPLQRSV